MGAYEFSRSVIGYFLLIASLGISTYAVREGQEYRRDVVKLQQFISEVYTISFNMTVISYILLGILLLLWKKLAGYSQIVLILSVSMLFTTVGADWINSLLEDYLFITIRYIVVQITCLALLILFVKDQNDLPKYALIGMFATAGGNVLNIIHIRKRISFHLTKSPSLARHLRPMITLFSNSLAIKIYLISDITILGIFLADQYVGYYSAASKAYMAIKDVIYAMILVTVPRFSFLLAQNDHESYNRVYEKVSDGIVTALAPLSVGLYAQAENILFFLGGKEYVAGTAALKILSFAMAFAIGASLFSQSILLPHKQEVFFLKATSISSIANIILNYILIPKIGIEAAAITTLLSEGIVCAMTFSRGRLYVDHILRFSKDMRSSLIGCAGIIVVCGVTNYVSWSRLSNLMISVIGSGIIYFLITYFLKNSTVIHIINRVKVL